MALLENAQCFGFWPPLTYIRLKHKCLTVFATGVLEITTKENEKGEERKRAKKDRKKEKTKERKRREEKKKEGGEKQREKEEEQHSRRIGTAPQLLFHEAFASVNTNQDNAYGRLNQLLSKQQRETVSC